MSWATAREFILPALKDGTEADVLADLKRRHAQLWEGDGAAFVTQITMDGYVHAWLAGGRLQGLLAMIPTIEAWGRRQGCQWASVTGRRGWDRVLRPFGYVRVGAELQKRL